MGARVTHNDVTSTVIGITAKRLNTATCLQSLVCLTSGRLLEPHKILALTLVDIWKVGIQVSDDPISTHCNQCNLWHSALVQRPGRKKWCAASQGRLDALDHSRLPVSTTAVQDHELGRINGISDCIPHAPHKCKKFHVGCEQRFSELIHAMHRLEGPLGRDCSKSV